MAGFDDVRSLQSAARRLEISAKTERPQCRATGSDRCVRGCEEGQSPVATGERVHHKQRYGGGTRSALFGDGHGSGCHGD